MPLGQPWLSKPIKKPMKNKQEDTKISLCPHCNCMTHTIEGLCGKCMNTKIKPDWEKEFVTNWNMHFGSGEYAVTHNSYTDIRDGIMRSIRDLLSKQEKQHKAEILHVKSNYREYINDLKQQHREELIGLRMERRDAQFKCDQEDHECRMALREVKSYNTAVDEFNKAITNLLEQKGK